MIHGEDQSIPVAGSLPLFLHVVSYDTARGAERYARDLVRALNAGAKGRHILLSIFAGDGAGLSADIQLEVPRGVMRDLGLDPRALGRLRRMYGAISPDAVVAHGGESAKYVALALPRRIPFVYLAIGSAHPLLANPLRAAMRRFYVKRATVIAAVSTDLAEETMREYGIARDRVQVVPNGRDTNAFRPRSDHRGKTNPRVVFVGRLDPQKRPDWFIEAIGELRSRGFELEASMVGGGPLEGLLSDRADGAGVEMLGTRDDVPGLLAGCDVLVCTSRPPEGMPGVLIEAGLSGLAVVSTRVPGAADVVEDGVTGLLVDIDDKPGLINALQRLLLEPELRSSMGAKGRERCSSLFSLESSVEEWETLFDGLGI